MTSSARAPSDPGKTELETVVDWPMIAVAGVLASLVLTSFVGLVLLSRSTAEPRPRPRLARRTPVRPTVVARPVAAPVVPRARALPAPTGPEAASVGIAKPFAEEREPAPAALVTGPDTTPPPPVKVVADTPRPAPPPAPQPRPQLSEPQLVSLLRHVPEVDLDAVADSSKKILEAARKAHPAKKKERARADRKADRSLPAVQPVLDLLARRPDLAGLPVRKGAECVAGGEEAARRGALSLFLRSKLSRRRTPDELVSESQLLREDAALTKLLSGKGWDRMETLSTLVQMLEVERPGMRSQLVKLVAAVKGGKAGTALARLAVFDLDEGVRAAAVEALQDRPPAESRPVLLKALRYPWAPVADHAAEALVVLQDRDATADLAALLDKPDPAAPYRNADKKWVQPELVRVNHLRNCLLCHAPSFDRSDLIRAPVPKPGEPLPQVYYSSSKGNLVRADVTYLRQDFSVMQPVANAGKWPKVQRYDYLVRVRELTAKECARLGLGQGGTAGDGLCYPQREAVLYALRSLTGKNAGQSTDAWRRLLAKGKDKRAR